MDLIAQLEAEQIAALGKDIPDFKAGDTIRVGYKVTEGTRTPRAELRRRLHQPQARQGHRRLVHRAQDFLWRRRGACVPAALDQHRQITVVRRGQVRRAKLYYLRARRGKSARIAEVTNYKALDGAEA